MKLIKRTTDGTALDVQTDGSIERILQRFDAQPTEASANAEALGQAAKDASRKIDLPKISRLGHSPIR